MVKKNNLNYMGGQMFQEVNPRNSYSVVNSKGEVIEQFRTKMAGYYWLRKKKGLYFDEKLSLIKNVIIK